MGAKIFLVRLYNGYAICGKYTVKLFLCNLSNLAEMLQQKCIAYLTANPSILSKPVTHKTSERAVKTVSIDSLCVTVLSMLKDCECLSEGSKFWPLHSGLGLKTVRAKHVLWTKSSAVTEKPRDASCSTVQYLGTHSSIISGFRFTIKCN